MQASAKPDWPAEIHQIFKSLKLRQIAFVPDAGHSRLIDLCGADPSMRLVSLTTEEEGIGVLAGAWLGGERGALLMQSSGVGNCINLFATAKTCAFPLLTLITMRGEWGEFNPWQVPMGTATPAVLEASGVIVHRADKAEEVKETVNAAARLAFYGSNQVAVLLSQRLIGTKSFED